VEYEERKWLATAIGIEENKVGRTCRDIGNANYDGLYTCLTASLTVETAKAAVALCFLLACITDSAVCAVQLTEFGVYPSDVGPGIVERCKRTASNGDELSSVNLSHFKTKVESAGGICRYDLLGTTEAEQYKKQGHTLD
jgi:hypothetical protein